MMSDKFLMLISPAPPTAGVDLVNQVLRQWATLQRPPIKSLTIEQVLNDQSLLDQCAVAWLVMDQPQHKRLYELTTVLQDHHVTGLLTRPGDNEPLGTTFLEGVITAAPNGDPAAIAVVLRTLWNQADVIKTLKTELSILHMHSKGVVDMFGKIDGEMRLAAQLQRDLLPKTLPQTDMVFCDVLFRPASYVSGDIYDVAQLDDSHIGFFLADAVGHGVPAALMTIYIKSAMAVLGLKKDSDDLRIIAPNEAMSRLNRAIVGYETDQACTATAVYGILNTDTYELLIARAGHPYPILLAADGATTIITAQGPMLGVFNNAQFDLQRIQLEPDDRLIIFSDGLETAFSKPEHGGTAGRTAISDQYLTEFKDLAYGSVNTALQRLGNKLDQQKGSLNQIDDLTVLLIAVEPSAVAVSCRVNTRHTSDPSLVSITSHAAAMR